jgi:hypothetical protein
VRAFELLKGTSLTLCDRAPFTRCGEAGEITVHSLHDDRDASRQGFSTRYLSDIRTFAGRFVKKYGERPAS